MPVVGGSDNMALVGAVIEVRMGSSDNVAAPSVY